MKITEIFLYVFCIFALNAFGMEPIRIISADEVANHFRDHCLSSLYSFEDNPISIEIEEWTGYETEQDTPGIIDPQIFCINKAWIVKTAIFRGAEEVIGVNRFFVSLNNNELLEKDKVYSRLNFDYQLDGFTASFCPIIYYTTISKKLEIYKKEREYLVYFFVMRQASGTRADKLYNVEKSDERNTKIAESVGKILSFMDNGLRIRHKSAHAKHFFVDVENNKGFFVGFRDCIFRSMHFLYDKSLFLQNFLVKGAVNKEHLIGDQRMEEVVSNSIEAYYNTLLFFIKGYRKISSSGILLSQQEFERNLRDGIVNSFWELIKLSNKCDNISFYIRYTDLLICYVDKLYDAFSQNLIAVDWYDVMGKEDMITFCKEKRNRCMW